MNAQIAFRMHLKTSLWNSVKNSQVSNDRLTKATLERLSYACKTKYVFECRGDQEKFIRDNITRCCEMSFAKCKALLWPYSNDNETLAPATGQTIMHEILPIQRHRKLSTRHHEPVLQDQMSIHHRMTMTSILNI
jgi:hypothetical protein